MFVIEYNPFMKEVSIPDGLVEKQVDEWLECPDGKIQVSNLLILDMFRVKVKEGKINCNNLIIKFKGTDIIVNKDGRYVNLPYDFVDYFSLALERLIF